MSLSAADHAAIRAAESRLALAFEDPDPIAWVECYTEDAIFIGPGAPPIEGRAGLLALAPQIAMSSVEINADSTLGAGDFAATTGDASWVSGATDSRDRVQRRFLMVWRRDGDGQWRIAREFLNEAP